MDRLSAVCSRDYLTVATAVPLGVWTASGCDLDTGSR